MSKEVIKLPSLVELAVKQTEQIDSVINALRTQMVDRPFEDSWRIILKKSTNSSRKVTETMKRLKDEYPDYNCDSHEHPACNEIIIQVSKKELKTEETKTSEEDTYSLIWPILQTFSIIILCAVLVYAMTNV